MQWEVKRKIHKHVCKVDNGAVRVPTNGYFLKYELCKLAGEGGTGGQDISVKIQHPRADLLDSAKCPSEVCYYKFQVKQVSQVGSFL